jgi:hypothetical protein
MNSTLYYPNIEFYDTTWLKASLLIYDKIFRIVPRSYSPIDSDEVKIAVDKNLLEDIHLNQSDLEQTAHEYEQFLSSVPVLPAAVEGYDNVRLHEEKVDDRIRPILEALSNKIDPDGFLSVSHEVANTYMLYLANVVSRRRGITKLTDDPDMFSIMHYFANNGNFDEWINNPDSKEVATSFLVPYILPKSVEFLSIDEIVKFRDKTQIAREAFKKSLDNFIDKASHVEDANFLKKHADEFISKLEKGRDSIAEQTKELAQDVMYSLISVGLPTTLTALSIFGVNSDIFALTSIGKSCFIGAVSSIADAAKSKRKEWKSSDSFYYLQLKKVFGDKTGVNISTRNYHRVFEEFIND